MTIALVLREKGSAVETIAADATVFDAVQRLGEKRIGALPVLEGGRIAGIMSERVVLVSRCRVHRHPSSVAGPLPGRR